MNSKSPDSLPETPSATALFKHGNHICRLPELGVIKISGGDAKKLLQGQFTCNIEEVLPGQPRMGAHCNPQGRILSLFYVFKQQDENTYYLLMPHRLIPLAITALKKYAIFYKTSIIDASADFAVIGYIGEEKIENPCIKIPFEKNTNRYLIIDNKNFIDQTWHTLSSSASMMLPYHWKQLDFDAGIPAIYPETSAQFLPHEINLDKLGALHFNKGCYTGQEIIARMHYRAKLKNHLYQAMITSLSAPLPGTDIYSKQNEQIKVSGVIVDICPQAQNHTYDVLILLDDENAKNHHLFLNENDQAFFTLIKAC